MDVNRMVASLCAFVCAMAGLFVVGVNDASAKSAVASRTAKVERQINRLEKLEWTYQSRIRFFTKNPERRWMLHLRYSHLPCWKVPLKGPERLCALSRGVVRVNTKRLAAVRSRIINLESVLRVLRNYRNWMCIHRHEGDWEDGGWPYVGGLQMDDDFVRTYAPDMIRKYGWPRFARSGPNGWLNPWTPEEQMMVAQRAYDGFAGYGPRGFYPWPNTARYCGLI